MVAYDDDDEWHAVVMRSFLDQRVWIAVIPDADNATNMGASTSVRRVKEYAHRTATTALYDREEPLVWHHENDEWVLRSA